MYKLKAKYEISSGYTSYSHDTLKPHYLSIRDVTF
jgi:hypothetical protein